MVMSRFILDISCEFQNSAYKALIADRRGSWPLEALACTRGVCLVHPAPWRAPELPRTCFAPSSQLASRNSASVAGQVEHRLFDVRSGQHPGFFRTPGRIARTRRSVWCKALLRPPRRPGPRWHSRSRPRESVGSYSTSLSQLVADGLI